MSYVEGEIVSIDKFDEAESEDELPKHHVINAITAALAAKSTLGT